MRRCITKSLLLLALFCGRSTSVAHENDWTASSNPIFGQTSILLGKIAEYIDIEKASKHIEFGVDIVRYFYDMKNAIEKLKDLSKQAKKISKIKKKVKRYLKWFLEDVKSQKDVSKRQRQVNYFATKIDESTYQLEIVKLKVETIAQRSRDTATKTIFTATKTIFNATKTILAGVPTFALGHIFPSWIGGIMKASRAFSTVTGVMMHVKIVWDSDQFARDIQEALAEFKDIKSMINAERDPDLPIFEDFDFD